MTHKDLLLKVALVLTLAASAGSAFAATATITSATTVGNNSFSPSTKVQIVAASAAGSYSIQACHLNGDRMFWTGSSDSRIYYNTKSTGSYSSTGINATDSAYTSWSSL
jgi:hypothetical protein